nr:MULTISPECIES: recombinase family protein [Pseudomonas syringae group genomosp. 2]
MALYGYARVSTSDQDFVLQEKTLREAGCDVVRSEKKSGASRVGRTELKTLLDFLRPGDTLVVTRVDRLARSIKDLQDIVYLTGEKPVSAELVESVLSRQLDDLEPTLTRHGYRIKDLVEQFDARPTEIKALFSNALDPARTTELRDRMLAAGLPI